MSADAFGDPCAPGQWSLVLTLLRGGRPPLPAHRSTIVHRIPDDKDEPEQLPTGTELAKRLGISRARALHRLRSVRHLPLEVALRELLKAPQQRHETGVEP